MFLCVHVCVCVCLCVCVIPFHAPNFKCICDKCVGNADGCSISEFKTAATYTFDTLIISEEVIKVRDCYIFHVRPLLNPVRNYLLVSTVGKQYASFRASMILLVKEAIGKYINPTQYPQIIETES